jgi:hypothetical protein
MTVNASTRRSGPYSGTGLIVGYSFNYKVFAATDLLVVTAVIATGVTTNLVLDSGYSVNLNADQDANPGGTVFYMVAGVPAALPVGLTLTIVGNLPFTQPTDITNLGGFYPQVIEDALDREVMLVQQTNDSVDRALLLNVATNQAFNTQLPAPVPTSLIGWAPDGLSITNYPVGIYADTAALIGALASPVGASMLGYSPTVNYAVGTIGYYDRLAPRLSTFTGADPTGATDSSAAIATAVALTRTLHIDKGAWKFNVTLPQRFLLFGDGINTTVQAFNTALAIFTCKSALFWTYQAEFRDMVMSGPNPGVSKVGIGVTFGQTVPANYVAGDEQAGNTRFFGVYGKGFDKFIQRPFGNIGVEVYGCGGQANKYAIYSLNNKFGSVMHAGNLQVFGGEFSANDCAIYIHNDAGGFGGVQLHGTILEQNGINLYCYTTNTRDPVMLGGVWNEGSGVQLGGTFALDQWSGTTLSTTVFTNRSFILDGADSTWEWRGGFFCDVYLKAVRSRVMAYNVRAEDQTSFAGGPCTVDDVDSVIMVDSPETDGGTVRGTRILTTGIVQTKRNAISTSADAPCRWFHVQRRAQILKNARSTTAISQKFTASQTTTGAFAVVGTVSAGGNIYQASNLFSVPFTLTSQFVSFPGTSIATSASSWYVCTFDAFRSSGGSPMFYFGDLGSNQLGAAMTVPEVGRWYTIGMIGQASGVATLSLSAGNVAATCDFLLSAFQVQAFATRHEAQAFLASRTYLEVGVVDTLPSAAALTLPFASPVVKVSGTTSITSISATNRAGDVVTLIFSGALTVTDGSNLVLAGNFVTTADDTITLACDGSNWWEVARSVN